MGFLKERQFEQGELGYSLDPAQEHLGVCPDCVADDGLQRFVAGNGPIEGCHFCGGSGPQGLGLGVLFHYMGGRIKTEWDLAINQVSWDAWERDAVDSSDLLIQLDEPLANDELRSEFVRAFQHDRVPRHYMRLAHHERLAYGWETFASLVKEKSRYLFLRTEQGPQDDEELIPPAELLHEVAMAIENGGLIRRLQPGRPLFRARRQAVPANPGELGSPRRELAGASRMSPPGIAMFYGAEDAETALTELHVISLAGVATVGRWTTARPLRYLDLVDVDVPTIFDVVGKSQRPWRLFLKGFAEDVSQPPNPGEEAVHYVPTQIFTEYVRDVLGDRDDPVRGIRYRSAVRPQGVCWVLFVDAGGCTEVGLDWEQEPGHWLGLESSSLRRLLAGDLWTEAT